MLFDRHLATMPISENLYYEISQITDFYSELVQTATGLMFHHWSTSLNSGGINYQLDEWSAENCVSLLLEWLNDTLMGWGWSDRLEDPTLAHQGLHLDDLLHISAGLTLYIDECLVGLSYSIGRLSDIGEWELSITGSGSRHRGILYIVTQ